VAASIALNKSYLKINAVVLNSKSFLNNGVMFLCLHRNKILAHSAQKYVYSDLKEFNFNVVNRVDIY